MNLSSPQPHVCVPKSLQSRGCGWLAPAAALCSWLLTFGISSAQLRPDEVLVVYDSRITDSRDVAEYYAGSLKVPGGAGGLAGARRGVRVFDLASSGATVTVPGNITYANFGPRLRVPIRDYLGNSGLAQRIRCLVLTKGLPHRILDSDTNDIMDFPGSVVDEIVANDANAASVDTELTLLWQDLTSGEAGGSADSKSDGVVLNPFWKSAVSITVQTNVNNTVAKTLGGSGIGPVWITSGGVTSTTRLNPGDIYLVCRLDGRTIADVRGMIDRAQNLYVNIQTAALLLDESASNGVADAASNGEFDNSGSGFPALRDADDYEFTRDITTADGRWAAANIRYNSLSGFNQFFVGPRLSWMNTHGILVTSPVVLVASYGANHSGQPLTSGGVTGGTVYATSYNYANGAVFNTIESYNCRDLGGLGQLPFAVQQQAADFIGAGGTFAVGNVWEPLADSVPDNRYLVQNFLLGNMCWAEAAWSSIPALSWMQIALGDPLARVQRSSEDINADGRVGADDLYAWEKLPTDINRNGTTDAADRTILVRAIRAAERTDSLIPR